MVKCVSCKTKYGHYNYKGCPPEYCGNCRKESMINVYKKFCVICNNCTPSFNFKDSKEATHCSTCKEPDMVDIKHPKCLVCNLTQPSYNFEKNQKATHCSKCALPGMKNIKALYCGICQEKQPTYNIPGSKKALRCKDCRTSDMIDVINVKCKICRLKRPTYNIPSIKVPEYCKECKTPDMLNVKDKRCVVCKISIPAFNFKGELRGTHCGKCKENGMIDVKSRTCVVCKSIKPIYNYDGNKTGTHCFKCKLSEMIDVKNVHCVICQRRSSFNYPEESKSLYCSLHKLDRMINVRHKKCSHCNLNYINQKYKPYCFDCYRFLNPDSLPVRNYKVKENTIMKLVKEKYPNCVLDSIITGGCSKRRPDGLIEFDDYSIIIEVDENCHRSYEDICENRRTMELFTDLGNRPLRLIRFNPDSWTDADGKRHDSIFSIDNKENRDKTLKVRSVKELNKRVQLLLETIDKIITEFKADDKSILVEYLFYNED